MAHDPAVGCRRRGGAGGGRRARRRTGRAGRRRLAGTDRELCFFRSRDSVDHELPALIAEIASSVCVDRGDRELASR
jgi:hypothetical protein